MKINFSQVLLDLSGMPLKDDKGEVTLRSVCVTALMAPSKDEVSGQEKFARWELAKSLSADEVDLKSEDVVKLKDLLGKTFYPAVVGPAFEMLECKLKVVDGIPYKGA